MHRDPSLRKRNALVIPGVLLMVLCLAGMVYAQALRPDTVECEDGRLIVLAGACRSAVLVLAIPFVLGIVLTIVGARIRGPNPCHLGHGTVATTFLALLIAFTALPLLGALALYLMQDPDAPYTLSAYGVDFGQTRVLAAVGLALALLMLLPFLLLYIATARPRRCCREKKCFEPCFCDEPAATGTIVDEQASVQTTTWSTPSTPTDALPPLVKTDAAPTRVQGSAPPTGPAGSTPPAQAPAAVVDDWGSPVSEDVAAKPKKKPRKGARKVTTRKKA